MSLILAIETATPVCSVTLARDGEILSLRESTAPNAHSAVLTTFIDELFTEAGFRYPDLDAVAVSMGPGSYTGLRIGVATAKGLCYALDKPLVAIPTLEAMAVGMIPDPGSRIPDLFCPMIDARRMEVYCAVYDDTLKPVRSTEAVVVDEFSFQDLLANQRVWFGGTGADKCREVFSLQPNAIFLDHFQASAAWVIPLAEQRAGKEQFEDLAYFEPYYLKDFVAGKPRVKGLK